MVPSMWTDQEAPVAITEAERHELFTRLEELLGPERTVTMSKLMLTETSDLATKADLIALEQRFKADLLEIEARMTRSFATWTFSSQAALVAMVGILLAIVRIF